MEILICLNPLNINESLVLIHITLCLMLFVCLSLTTNPSLMNIQIDFRD